MEFRYSSQNERLNQGGGYQLIWHPIEAPDLGAVKRCLTDSQWWYCNKEFLTVQFLRSGFHNDTVLLEGRIAIATTDKDKNILDPTSAPHIEKRYVRLRNSMKEIFTNQG